MCCSTSRRTSILYVGGSGDVVWSSESGGLATNLVVSVFRNNATSRPVGQPEGPVEGATAVSEGGLERPQSTPYRPQVSRKSLRQPVLAGQPEGAAEDATAVSEGGLERPQSTPSRPQVSRKFLCPTCSTRSRCHPVAAYAKVTPAAAGSKPFGHRVSLSAFENVNCIRFLGREILAAVPNRGSPPMRSFAGPRRSGPPCRGSPCQGFAFLGAAHESMRTPGFKMAFGSSSRLTERIDSANKLGRCAS